MPMPENIPTTVVGAAPSAPRPLWCRLRGHGKWRTVGDGATRLRVQWYCPRCSHHE